MNKKEINRQLNIKNLIAIITVSLLIALFFLFIYISNNKGQYITYNENSNVDYKVYLKQNDFYKKEYLDKDKSYVASLINTISTNFKYNLSFSPKTKYKYSYRIAIEIDVEDEKDNSSIYHVSEDLVTKTLSENVGDLEINEDLSVNYSQYNNRISKFKDIYDLNNIVSKLNINLYVNIQDIENATKDLKERKVSSLTIPLTEKTVSVDIGDESIVNNNKQIDLVRTTNSVWAISASILFFFVSIIYTMFLILYSRKTRTAQMIYEKEIKSIMSNYDSYIQKINGSYDIGTSQVLKIETFNDMLEIRDTLRQPILMLENEQKNGTFFIIPATNSIIYTYALRVVDIKAKIDGKEIPTYDITEIPHQDFKKKKKYTDEYIKDQITMTTAMKKVDADNVIKGNKDKDTNLYDQLEKTSSYKFKFKK
ncbi:MAG: hypothetical protein IJG97_03205 [Bacilli bacterium]|nr:hypothetical protein [Bacilli bacterium]